VPRVYDDLLYAVKNGLLLRYCRAGRTEKKHQLLHAGRGDYRRTAVHLQNARKMPQLAVVKHGVVAGTQDDFMFIVKKTGLAGKSVVFGLDSGRGANRDQRYVVNSRNTAYRFASRGNRGATVDRGRR
jgi:hypothetical protein